MNELDILKWAAGAKTTLPQFAGFTDERILYLLGLDETKLIDLLVQHRLAARFLHRFQQERPGWCSKNLLAQILAHNAEAQKRTRQQMQAAEEINSVLTPTGKPLIIVKGFTAYALTGNEHSIRTSGDMDLFFADLDYLWEQLQRLGYSGEKLSEGVHEFAKMSRGDIMLELHRYFPVFTYPQQLLAANLDPRQNPGCWTQTFPDFTEQEITYDALLANAVPGIAPQTTNLVFPDATMAVFLLCVHLLKHYTMHLATTGNTIIKLVELSEVVHLTAHPQFDHRRFLAHSDRFGGRDSIRFVGDLCEAFFGYNPLPMSGKKPGGTVKHQYPQWMAKWTCWVSYGSVNDMLVPSYSLPIIEALGPTTVVASQEAPSETYSVFTQERGTPIRRVILYTTQNQPIPFQFSITWGMETLGLTFRVLRLLKQGSDELWIDLRRLHPFRNCWVAIKNSGIKYGPDELEVTLVTHNEEYLLRVGIPWAILPAGLRQSTAIPLLLEMTMQDGNSLQRCCYDPVMLIPLNIVRENAEIDLANLR